MIARLKRSVLALACALIAVSLYADAQPSARGDVNADAVVDGSDVTYLAKYLLGEGPAPVRSCLGDVNADASVSSADAVRLIDYLFAAGTPPPPQPTEVCNGVDDNCNTVIDEGYDLSIDPHNCGTCGNECVGLNSTNLCIGSVCSPTCSFGWASCDDNPNNGCELLIHTNPSCSTAGFLGVVSGDTGATVLTASGNTEAFYRVTVKEEDSSVLQPRDLTARVFLQVPAAVDFNLFVRCLDCSGNPAGSINPTGQSEELYFKHNDSAVADDTFDLLIEIRLFSAQNAFAACTQWQLTIHGNVDTTGHQVQSCP
ncbi:MAG: dockerin type I repeat-containing protein [Thermoanaerobaculia bacterium]